jgi:hypothetical protein
MHGHFGPHLGEAAVLEARYVEVGLAWELAELGREQDGAGELGDGSNGAAVTRLALRARARRRRGGKNGELVKEGAGAAVLEASARGVLRTATRQAALTAYGHAAAFLYAQLARMRVSARGLGGERAEEGRAAS